MSNPAAILKTIYDSILERYGPQGWWPADTAEEMIIGAILVQHSAWKNVEKAIARLREHRLLDLQAIAACDDAMLAEVIRSAGTPGVKSRRLKDFAAWLGEHYHFDLARLLALPTPTLRSELLAVRGIGPETADCIILYAAGRAVFVADTYAQRVFARHRVTPHSISLRELKGFVETHLPLNPRCSMTFMHCWSAWARSTAEHKPGAPGAPWNTSNMTAATIIPGEPETSHGHDDNHELLSQGQ